MIFEHDKLQETRILVPRIGIQSIRVSQRRFLETREAYPRQPLPLIRDFANIYPLTSHDVSHLQCFRNYGAAAAVTLVT